MTPATDATRAANAAVLDELPFGDRTDLDHAGRGRLAPLPDTVTTAGGGPVWDSHRFDFVDGDAPPTANPSLWRQELINGIGGLFEVVDGIYQVRNLDLSNISFIRGETGWIVLDPLITAEVAAAALELVNTHVERLPVTAVVYSHSHADHFGGVRGVCTPEDVAAGRVRIVAPEGFTVEAVSENVMAGNAMSRRASYMYGNLLPPSPTGQIGAGLVDRMEEGETSPPFRWDDFPDQNAKTLAALPPSSGPERITTYVRRAHEWVDRVAALDPEQPLGVPPQDIVASQITLGSFIAFSANEWHAHAWDLGAAIGEGYRPTNPEVLLEGLRSWFPQLESRGDSWRVVLRFQGRSLT